VTDTRTTNTPSPCSEPSTDSRGLEELPSGRWRVKLRDPTRPGRWMPGGSFATRAEAVDYRNGLLAILAGVLRDETVVDEDSLQSFGDSWLDERELAGDCRSVDTFRSQWRHVSGSEIAKMQLRAITAVDVRAWLDATLTKKALVVVGGGAHTHAPSKRRLSRSTVSKVLSMLRQVFERAVEKGLVRTNPCRDVKVRKSAQARAHDVWTYLTLAEIARLEACVGIPENYRTVYLIAIYTGLREGELWGLHWRDVDLTSARPELVVRFSRRGAPKNGRVRRVPLLGRAVELFTAWRKLAPKSEEGLVFPTRTGEMRSRGDDARWADYHAPMMREGRRVSVRCEGQSKKLRLGRPARFHDLRHTCASHLIMGSWGVQWTLSEIAAFLGHSDTEVTERYAHLSPDHLHAKAAVTAQRGTRSMFHGDPPVDRKQLARPRGLEPLTSRSVAPSESEGASRVTAEMERVWNTARTVLQAAASGGLPERSIADLLEAVEGLELLQLATELRTARGPARVVTALRTAVAALNLSDGALGGADSADSADRRARKRL
jgi:integrase